MMPTTMTNIPDLAHVLFASTLQPSADPSPEQVRRAIDDLLGACGDDLGACAAYSAQEAGDHPEEYAHRMHWALHAVALAYPAYRLAA